MTAVVCVVSAVLLMSGVFASGAQASTATTTSGLNGLAGLLCPTTSTVSSAVSGLLSPLGSLGLGSVTSVVNSTTSALSTATCNLGVLSVDYHTVFVTSSGQTITKDTSSLVGVPTALNVDNGVLPDMSADITLTGSTLNTAELQISRDSDSGTLPVEVEAIITDSAGAFAGRDSFAVGYDATASNAPGSFTLSTPLSDLTDSSGTYAFTLTQSDPGSSISVLGSAFDGAVSSPTDVDSFSLSYGASPTSATISVSPGSSTSATLDQNTTGPATLTAETTSGSGTENLSLGIDDLPSALTVGVNSSTAAVTWSASAAVSQVTASLSSTLPIALGATNISATLSDLPTSFTLSAAQTADGMSLTSTNPIGELDLDASSAGESYPTIPAGQGGVVLNTTNGISLGLRVYGLQQVSYTSDPLSLTTQMAAGHVFSVDADVSSTDANVTVTDMPASLSLSVDPTSGDVKYSASDTVSSLTGTLDSTESLLLGADHLQFALDGLPTSFDLNASQTSGGVDVSSNNPIGEVQLYARSVDDSYPTIPAGQGGVYYDDTDGLSLGFQAYGLQEIDFSTSPLSVSTQMAGGYPFSVTADVAETGADGTAENPLDADLSVTDMPAQMSLAIDPSSDEIDYSASSTVSSITGSIDSPTDLFFGADHLQFALDQLPTSFDMSASQSGGGLDLQSTNPIGGVTLYARSDNQSYPAAFPANTEGVDVDNTDGVTLGVQVYGLTKIDFDSSPLAVTADTAGGYPFSLNANLAETDASGNAESPLTATMSMSELPASLSLGVDSSGGIDYSASDSIDQISATISSPTAVLLGATSLSLTMDSVPQSVSLNSSNGLSLSAPGGIGTLQLFAASANQQYPSIPGGDEGVSIDNTNGLALGVQLYGVSSIDYSPSPLTLSTQSAPGHVFGLNANLTQSSGSPIDVSGTITDLPASFSLGVGSDGNGGSELTLNNSGPISNLTLSADGLSLLQGADDVQVGIDNVPTSVTVDLPSSGPVATISANAAIGQLQLAAGNDADGPVTLPADTYTTNTGTDDELDFNDVPGQFAIAARLTGVQDASFGDDPVSLNLTQDSSSRPIDLDAQFQNSNGTTATVSGTPAISKPSTETGITVNVPTSGGATSLTLTNAAPLAEVNLTATNLGSISSATLTLQNLPTSLSVCLDSGTGCERANPTEASGTDTESPAKNGNSAGMNRPYPATVSLNFDDHGSSGTSAATSSMVEFNGSITEAGSSTPITISNVYFHNLEMDLAIPGPTFSYCVGEGVSVLGHTECIGTNESVPYMYMFIDSSDGTGEAYPFVVNNIVYPPTVAGFQIGTDSSPAYATDRLYWIQGASGTADDSLDQSSTGGLSCGGASTLDASTSLGTINLIKPLDLFTLLNICGGSVTDQP